MPQITGIFTRSNRRRKFASSLRSIHRSASPRIQSAQPLDPPIRRRRAFLHSETGPRRSRWPPPLQSAAPPAEPMGLPAEVDTAVQVGTMCTSPDGIHVRHGGRPLDRSHARRVAGDAEQIGESPRRARPSSLGDECPAVLRSRQSEVSTASIPASCWMSWQVTWALYAGAGAGPVGTLMQSDAGGRAEPPLPGNSRAQHPRRAAAESPPWRRIFPPPVWRRVRFFGRRHGRQRLRVVPRALPQSPPRRDCCGLDRSRLGANLFNVLGRRPAAPPMIFTPAPAMAPRILRHVFRRAR